MNKLFIFFFSSALSIVATLNAQTQQESITQSINKILVQEKEHLPPITFEFKADSFSIKSKIIEVFFNKNTSYLKGTLPANYIEMLPELLMPAIVEFNDKSLLLLAKEKGTNKWKTLDYFGNLPASPIYKLPENKEPQEPKKGETNTTVNRIFTSGTGSPIQAGALSGKTIWISPGHGWHNTSTFFNTQRGTSNEIVEDFTTIETINNYLTYYLTNSGANVWSVRERDNNTNEIIVDNDVISAGYAETGSWSVGSLPGYGGTYKVAITNATETAAAIYTPSVTQSGYYWVSVRCIAGTNRATDVAYTIIHSGDTSIVKVNQEIHSDTWVYVGQFYFTAGMENKIIQSNKSNEAGQAIIADAIRLGGGVGATADCGFPTPSASGKPRFEESAKQYSIFQKYPTCNEDVTVRPRFAEYEAAKGTATELNNSVYVAFHTNAGGGTGTETYSYNGLGSGRPTITAGSVNLTSFIHNQIIADIRANYKPSWADRGVKTANFGELRELNTMPGTLIELAFHDRPIDANDMKNPEFRRLAARAIYKGILKFFNNRDGTPLVFLPEHPTHIIAKNIGSNSIQLSWNAPATGGIFGNPATGYKVYVSTNGKSFKDGISVATNTFTFTGNPQTTYYFKIAATNAGGESFSSNIVAAKTPAAGIAVVPYLIVDGFDRIDSTMLIPKFESTSLGIVKRMNFDRMNRYDYMVDHAKSLSSCFTFAFDGCLNEAVSAGSVLLNTYQAVDWFTGEEGVTDFSLDATERTLLKTYLNAGGHLLLSGSDIGVDIGNPTSPNVDLDFYNNYLKASYVEDDANTYNFTGTSTFFTAQNGSFDNATNGYYDVHAPDRINAFGGSTLALNYVGGTADGAAIGFKGTYNLLYLAFPLEAITSTTIRNNIMCNAIAYLTPSIPLPIIGITMTGKNEGNKNIISWITKVEINVKHMVVEQSDNGIFFSETSANYLPKGNGNEAYTYAFEDKNVLKAHYYRIKIVDLDGKITFSNTIFLKAIKSNQFATILSNPIRGNLKINFRESITGQLILSNTLGQIVYSNKINQGNGTIVNIDVSRYTKGVYTLSILSNSQKQVEKIVIQ